MTKLLEQAIETIRTLPESEQDVAARFLLDFARQGQDPLYDLDDDQLAEVELAKQEADRGEFATDEEMDEIRHRFGRSINEAFDDPRPSVAATEVFERLERRYEVDSAESKARAIKRGA